jgi:hypothetical protein
MLDRIHARVALVVACARRDARSDRKHTPRRPDLPRKKIFGRRRIGAPERTICAKLRNFRDTQTHRARRESTRAREVSGNLFRVTAGRKIDAVDRQCSSLSISSA